MPFPVFNPVPRPSPGAAIQPKPNIIKANLGDGYQLASPRGLNHMPLSLQLRWDALTLAEAQALDGFFRGQGGYKPFWWTLRSESTPRKWTCEEWVLTDDAPVSFPAVLVENFTAET